MSSDDSCISTTNDKDYTNEIKLDLKIHFRSDCRYDLRVLRSDACDWIFNTEGTKLSETQSIQLVLGAGGLAEMTTFLVLRKVCLVRRD